MRYFQYGNVFLPDGENTTHLSGRDHHRGRDMTIWSQRCGKSNHRAPERPRRVRALALLPAHFHAYLGSGRSQLPSGTKRRRSIREPPTTKLGEYYMSFREKADYAGHYDAGGIPMLDYRGAIGLQYNPIAIAQWGLANYNRFCETRRRSPAENS